MKITNIQNDYYFFMQNEKIKKQETRQIEPVSSINPSMHIPDSAYLEAMQVLGTNIDIKI